MSLIVERIAFGKYHGRFLQFTLWRVGYRPRRFSIACSLIQNSQKFFSFLFSAIQLAN